MSDEDRPSIVEKKWQQALHPEDPAVQVYVLATRVEALTKEKEALEKTCADLSGRLAKIERAFDRGAGILLLVPILGGFVGWIISYWKVISKPWTNQ